jgi:membrane protein required for colicin V production
MYLDAAAFGAPAVLGLLGAWLGFGRFSVFAPIRWLVTVLGASVAALLAALYLVVNRELAEQVYLSGTVATTVLSAVVFLVVLVPLAMFMSNLKARVVVWTAHRRTGSAGRLLGALFGILCGLVLLAIPILVYDWLMPERSDDPGWMRESLALPYFRGAADAAKGALSDLARLTEGLARWRWRQW